VGGAHITVFTRRILSRSVDGLTKKTIGIVTEGANSGRGRPGAGWATRS